MATLVQPLEGHGKDDSLGAMPGIPMPNGVRLPDPLVNTPRVVAAIEAGMAGSS